MPEVFLVGACLVGLLLGFCQSFACYVPSIVGGPDSRDGPFKPTEFVKDTTVCSLLEQSLFGTLAVNFDKCRSDTLEPVCVLDTKYKTHKPLADDIAQVVAYAESKGCREAVLIYPQPVETALDERIGDIRARAAGRA